jgi:hypothetical protein
MLTPSNSEWSIDGFAVLKPLLLAAPALAVADAVMAAASAAQARIVRDLILPLIRPPRVVVKKM